MALQAMILLVVSVQADYSTLHQQELVEYRRGHFGESEKLLLGIIAALDPTDDKQRAATLAELGDAYASEGDLPKAERAYSAALTIYSRLSDKRNRVRMMRNLGSIYSIERRDDEASHILHDALKLAEGLNDSVVTAEVLNNLGNFYYRKGKNGKAEKCLDQALKMTSRPGIAFDTAGLLNNLGAIYVTSGKFDKAETYLKRSLELGEKELGLSHPDLTVTLDALGVLYTEMKRYSDAEDQYRRALKILDGRGSDFDSPTARTLHLLSVTYYRAGRKGEAVSTLADAAAIAGRNLEKNPEMVAIVEDYAATLKMQGKTVEAEQFRAQAKRMRISAGLVIRAHNP